MANPQPDKHTRLSNEILEKLAMIRISGEARQMLDVILRKTYGWGKKNDDIATSQFMQLTGLSRLAIPKARKKLIQMNLITVSKKGYSAISQKGHSQVLTYSFQKDYDKWISVSKKVYCIPKSINYIPKSIKVYTKKVTNCIPKGSTQKKERNYTKETIQKKDVFPYLEKDNFDLLWKGWLEVRKKLKVPDTDLALNIALKKLHKEPIDTAIKMLEQAIEKGWKGIYPIKEMNNGNFKGNIKQGSEKKYESIGTDVAT